MQAIGLIVEYNPFHNGHFYHLQAAKELYPDAIIIAIMSGNFLQRGEPALLDKWTRTKLALHAGIDLVLELPFAHAVQKADQFADHSVRALNALGVTSIVFGSELGDIAPFYEAYEQYRHVDTSPTIRPLERMRLAFEQTGNAVFTSPNNTLGFWYVHAQQQLNPNIQLATITRKSAAYHDYAFHGTIASATAIRRGLLEGWECHMVVPKYTLDALHTQPHVTWETLYPHLRHLLLTTPLTRLKSFALVSEGIEHRLYEMALRATTFADFIQLVKTKRYSLTHLQRMCTYILTQTTQNELDDAQQQHYLRLLGASPTGLRYLKQQRKTLSWPVVTNLKQSSSLLADLEFRATLAYAPAFSGHEYVRKPIFTTEL